MKKTPFFLLLFFFAAYGQQEQSFLDSRDGKKYRVVKIGNQTWMGENLNYNPGTGISACYDNEPGYCTKYGRLYDWETAMKTCPPGWHLPNQEEWNTLSSYVESNSGCSRCNAIKLKDTSDWCNNGYNTDDYGFSALPGGGNSKSDGHFHSMCNWGYWWSASDYYSYSDYAYTWVMYYGSNYAYWSNSFKSELQSVRCLQDY
ncbi:MAG: hypothetical protein LBQ87_07865 [Candidatus Fibromonas sp.]|jgi:uncharacterized protein (TIGR02145 family)|nr:hypothetical protein [Candidatus Fibromonas sp.]